MTLKLKQFAHKCWSVIGRYVFTLHMRRAMRSGQFMNFIRHQRGDQRNTEDVVLYGRIGERHPTHVKHKKRVKQV